MVELFGTWYRFQETHYAGPTNDYGDPIPGSGTTKVELEEYRVQRETEKCVTLRRKMGDFTGTQLHIVKKTATKRFACPTPKEAYDSFMARKLRQIKILEAQIKGVEKAIHAAEVLKWPGCDED